jgi:hypothetical protein
MIRVEEKQSLGPLGGQKFDADDNDYANVILLPMPM